MGKKQNLEILIKNFIQKTLPGRIQKIVDLIPNILNTNLQNQLIHELESQAHKLRGTTSTYGILDVPDVLFKIEEFAKQNQTTDRLSSEQQAILVNLISELEVAAINPMEEQSSELQPIDNILAQSAENSTGKIVFLVEQDDRVSHDLIKQFAVYGYPAHLVSNIEEVINYISNEINDIIIIINTVFLEKVGSEISILASLKEKKVNLTLAFISDHGDFDLRLKAVKARADAYFVLPVDVGEIIDKLNTFTTNNKPYHILIVDDDPDLVAYYAHILQQKNMITSVVSNPLEVVSQIISTKPELILMDLNMPNCNGWELAKIIRQQEAFVSIPIVFLSSEKDVERQYEALRYGGDDFISKKTPDKELIESIRIRAERYRTLRFYMERDSLTGLLNHTRTIDQLSAELLKAKRMKLFISFAMIDLDHFKKVNDTFGHLIGDKVLKRLARLLKERLRKSDIIGRYGGEEFSIILPYTDNQQALTVLNNIREKFAEMQHKAPHTLFPCTLSAGIATFYGATDPLSVTDFAKYIKKITTRVTNIADQALFMAKKNGRNQIAQGANLNIQSIHSLAD